MGYIYVYSRWERTAGPEDQVHGPFSDSLSSRAVCMRVPVIVGIYMHLCAGTGAENCVCDTSNLAVNPDGVY